MHGLLLADTPADPNSTSSWVAIVIALLTIIYIVFVRPMKKKRDRDPLARQPNQTLLSQQRSIERDMTALLVEYEQMMRTMSAQIDMRTTKLDLLVREADEKIAALKAAAVAQPTPSASTTEVPPIVQPVETRTVEKSVPAAESIVEKSAASITPAAHAEHLAREARDLVDMAGVTAGDTADPADPHAQIYDLADRGLTYRQIAHQLDRAYGEIELILALRPKTVVETKESVVVDAETVSDPNRQRRNRQRRKQHS